MSVFDGPDDILGSPCRVTPEKDPSSRTLEGRPVDDRLIPLVELDPNVPFDPGKRSFLANRQDHCITGNGRDALDLLVQSQVVLELL